MADAGINIEGKPPVVVEKLQNPKVLGESQSSLPKEVVENLPDLDNYPPRARELIVEINDQITQLSAKLIPTLRTAISEIATAQQEQESLMQLKARSLKISQLLAPGIQQANSTLYKGGRRDWDIFSSSWVTPDTYDCLKRLDSLLLYFNQKRDSFYGEFDEDVSDLYNTPLGFNIMRILDLKSQAERNREFPESRDLFTHMSVEHWHEILLSGRLASQKSQIDDGGKAHFASGRNKAEAKEAFPVYFYDDVAGDRVIFVFSQRKVLGQGHQVALSDDGLVVYDKHFHTPNGDEGEGFKIDLTEEDFLLVAPADIKVEEFLRDQVLISNRWRDKVTDVDAWINKHVLILNKRRMTDLERSTLVKDAFFARFDIPVLKKGFFVPTGEFDLENNYVHGPLYMFRQTE